MKSNKGKKMRLIAAISIVIGTGIFTLLKALAELETDYMMVSTKDEDGKNILVQRAKRGLWHKIAENLRKL